MVIVARFVCGLGGLGVLGLLAAANRETAAGDGKLFLARKGGTVLVRHGEAAAGEGEIAVALGRAQNGLAPGLGHARKKSCPARDLQLATGEQKIICHKPALDLERAALERDLPGDKQAAGDGHDSVFDDQAAAGEILERQRLLALDGELGIRAALDLTGFHSAVKLQNCFALDKIGVCLLQRACLDRAGEIHHGLAGFELRCRSGQDHTAQQHRAQQCGQYLFHKAPPPCSLR